MRLMYGRYGVDSMGKATLSIGLAFAVITWFTDSSVFPILSWACIIYTYFRMFSKNIYKRAAENRIYQDLQAALFLHTSEKHAVPAQDASYLQVPVL